MIPCFVVSWYLINGYAYGTLDHNMLVPLADLAIGQSPIEDDYLFSTSHPTLAWYLYAPFVLSLGHELGYFTMHILCLAVLAASVISLTRVVASKEHALLASSIALVLSLPLANTFGSIHTFDPILIPRVLSIGPLLFALTLAARGRFALSFALAGVVFNLHPTTAAHGTFIVGGLWLASRPVSPKRLLEPAAFFAMALPMLGMTIVAGAGSQVSTPYPLDWFHLAEVTWPYHHFLQRSGPGHYFFGGIPFFIWLIARVNYPSRAIDVMMIMIPIFCAIGYFMIYTLRMPQALALHVFESTRFASYFGFAISSAWLAKALLSDKKLQVFAGLIGLAAVIGWQIHLSHIYEITGPSYLAGTTLAIACVVYWWSGRDSEKLEFSSSNSVLGRWSVAVIVFAGLFIIGWSRIHSAKTFNIGAEASLTQAYQDNAWFIRMEFPEDASPSEKAGLDLMAFAKKSIPKDALVAIPPSMMHPLVSFRLMAERRIFVCWKDGGEVVFSEKFGETWRERIVAVSSPEAVRPFPPGDIPFSDWTARVGQVMDMYQGLNREQLLALHSDFRVTHAVRPVTAAPVDLPIAYEDRAFRIYTLTPE